MLEKGKISTDLMDEKSKKNENKVNLEGISSDKFKEEILEKLIERTKNYAIAEWNEIIKFVRKPWRLLLVNFFIGLLRGIGFFLGMTIVGAIILALILVFIKPMVTKIIQLNIPVISDWLARLIKEVQSNLGSLP